MATSAPLPLSHSTRTRLPCSVLLFAALAFLLAWACPATGQFIRLEDVTAGGDGLGNAPPENTGIDPRAGAFTNGYFAGHITDTDGVNPASVSGSPYIDSVFLPKGKVPTPHTGWGRLHA